MKQIVTFVALVLFTLFMGTAPKVSAQKEEKTQWVKLKVIDKEVYEEALRRFRIAGADEQKVPLGLVRGIALTPNNTVLKLDGDRILKKNPITGEVVLDVGGKTHISLPGYNKKERTFGYKVQTSQILVFASKGEAPRVTRVVIPITYNRSNLGFGWSKNLKDEKIRVLFRPADKDGDYLAAKIGEEDQAFAFSGDEKNKKGHGLAHLEVTMPMP